MNFNPFDEKPDKIDSMFMDWEKMYPKAYDKNATDPYTKVRCILLNGAEYEAVWFLHRFFRECNNNDVRRQLALIRKSEQQQQKRISCLKPLDESVLETTIAYEQLAVDLTAIMASREPNRYVKQALDFALLEDFDHLYRYSDLLDMEHGIKSATLVKGYTEVTPGRPTISEHRYPFDDVKRYTDFKTADPITKLDVSIITAAEQQTMNYYMNQAAFYTSDLGRRLFQEIGMIEEQHVTQYGSLIDVNCTPLENWLMHEYGECYLYYSAWTDETDPYIKNIWENHLRQEIIHLHTAKDLLYAIEKKDWRQVIPDGSFPEPIRFSPQIDYIRNVLKNTVTLTASMEDYEDICSVPDTAKFFVIQNILNHSPNKVASHCVISDYIETHGKDYRVEKEKNPVFELQNRREDNISLGRVKECFCDK